MQDSKKDLYEARRKCYELIHKAIGAVDQVSANDPGYVDGQYTAVGRRKSEAYDVINESEDEVFQTNLYDWYLSQGWSERLLEIRSPFVVKYLDRRSREEQDKADLLWNYHARRREFWDAAQVQLQLAKSDFDISLDSRIEYLARARANASTGAGGSLSKYGTPGLTRQELLRESGDMIEVADIQSDLVQMLKSDERLRGERRTAILKQLEGKIQDVDTLYNQFIDAAGYYDLALQAFVCANYRNKPDIISTWQNLIAREHSAAEAEKNTQPWERVAETVRTMGRKLQRSEWVFGPSKFPLTLTPNSPSESPNSPFRYPRLPPPAPPPLLPRAPARRRPPALGAVHLPRPRHPARDALAGARAAVRWQRGALPRPQPALRRYRNRASG